MNTKTAEEKPDFKTMASQYNNSDVSLHDWIKDGSHRGAHAQNVLNYTKGCERIWDDYVTPLKKRIEELEEMLMSTIGYFELGADSKQKIREIRELLNPSTNEK